MGLTVDLYQRFMAFKTIDVEKYKSLSAVKNIAALVLDRKRVALKSTSNDLLDALLLQLDSNFSSNNMDAVSACNEVIMELNALIESLGLL